MAALLFTPLDLPNGARLPNRIAKAATEENLAGSAQAPDDRLVTLYRRWSAGGAGLLITGNVMVDGRALTGPAGVVLEADTDLTPFRRWAEAAKSGGAQVWMQISHPGRQVQAAQGGLTWSPSDVAMDLGKHSKLFARPTPMGSEDIAETIARFAATARQAEAAGFDGVEIHGAHGYLLSQFLSPLTNRRTDRWGGAIENRARLLIEAVKAVRAVVRPGFAVAVKLNSADFQRGGFDQADAVQVIRMLNDLPVDLLELSGGSYESPAMQGRTADGHTLAREAYFLEFAVELQRAARMPVMVTGGIRSRATAEKVIASGMAVAGMATSLALAPDLPRQWREREQPAPALPLLKSKNKVMVSLASQAFILRQLRRLGRGAAPKLSLSPLVSLLFNQYRRKQAGKRYQAWLARRYPELG
ncbi:MAG: 2,4-dienoyl-CoA reductase [Rhodospirillales bacterium]|nr:2,4-dienoyl-CoA reductase [Rhodospirillales bacterium]